MIFMLDHYCEATEVVDDNQLKSNQVAKTNERGSDERRIITRYFQVKRQMLVTDNQKMWVLQIIDISTKILYNIATGEKKLLALINATVSHEMRNPLNSIYSQNIKLIQVNEKLSDLIKTFMNKRSDKPLKKRIKRLQKELVESNKMQMSSSKILNFLVNDILDFS